MTELHSFPDKATSSHGDSALAEAVGQRAARHFALILAHHGPILAGRDLRAAGHAIEELEQTARLALLLDDRPHNLLSAEDLAELDRRFPPQVWLMCG